jgi:hypothetical protein
MKAWLLTWEGTNSMVRASNRKIIAILSARCTPSSVETLVDTIYCRSIYSAHEMAGLANRRKSRRHQFRHLKSNLHRFYYGGNPCIFARVVSDLNVVRDENQKIETVRWTELSTFQNASSGSLPIPITHPLKCELIRALEPLSDEIYEYDNLLIHVAALTS